MPGRGAREHAAPFRQDVQARRRARAPRALARPRRPGGAARPTPRRRCSAVSIAILTACLALSCKCEVVIFRCARRGRPPSARPGDGAPARAQPCSTRVAQDPRAVRAGSPAPRRSPVLSPAAVRVGSIHEFTTLLGASDRIVEVRACARVCGPRTHAHRPTDPAAWRARARTASGTKRCCASRATTVAAR